jgi:hypothetical protein
MLVAPAWAQAPPTTDSADIVVTGVRLQEMAQGYVAEVSSAPQSEDQLARWSDRICPGAVGLSSADAQRVVDRIAMRAQTVGLRPGAPGCRANVMVIYAPDSDALARQIVDRRRDLLGYYGDEGVVTPGRDALEAFASTPRPVRWWHVAQTTSAEGQALGNSETRAGGSPREAQAAAQADNIDPSLGIGVGSFEGMEAVRSSGSRMRRNTRQDLNYVLIVVDARRVAGVRAEAWMDYVAMVALAQVNPDAQAQAFPTILNLFSAPQNAPAAMTDWDTAYLQGLYAATREAANARQQRAQIADRIASSVAPPQR